MKKNLLRTSTFFVTNLVYVFVLLSWVTIDSITNLIDRWSHRTEMTVYLHQGTKPEDIEKIKKILNKYEERVTSTFQSEDLVREKIKALMPKIELDFSTGDEFLTSIPPHFIVKAQSDLNGSSLIELFKKLSGELKQNLSVESASFGESWLQKYLFILNSLKEGSFLFFTGLFFAVILVIGNSIRSHIHSRREEIEILELVGATQFMIRRPFLVEGTLISIFSMILSFIFVSLLISILKNSSGPLTSLIDIKSVITGFSTSDWLVGILLSAVIGFFGSFLCLAEINNGWAASNRNQSFLKGI